MKFKIILPELSNALNIVYAILHTKLHVLWCFVFSNHPRNIYLLVLGSSNKNYLLCDLEEV